MAEEKKERLTLTDEDMITSPKITRRVLLAGAGVALGGVALAGRSVKAAEADKDNDEDDDKDNGEADKDDEDEKDKGEAENDDGEDDDKADAESDRDAD